MEGEDNPNLERVCFVRVTAPTIPAAQLRSLADVQRAESGIMNES